MRDDTFTVIATPEQWAYVSAYEGYSFDGRAERFGVTLTDPSLLPEEIAAEAYTDKRGGVPLKSYWKPAVEHYAGWEHLELELRRMEAGNRSPDDLFEGHTLELTITPHILPVKPGYNTPLLILAVSLIKILAPAETANGEAPQPA